MDAQNSPRNSLAPSSRINIPPCTGVEAGTSRNLFAILRVIVRKQWHSSRGVVPRVTFSTANPTEFFHYHKWITCQQLRHDCKFLKGIYYRGFRQFPRSSFLLFRVRGLNGPLTRAKRSKIRKKEEGRGKKGGASHCTESAGVSPSGRSHKNTHRAIVKSFERSSPLSVYSLPRFLSSHSFSFTFPLYLSPLEIILCSVESARAISAVCTNFTLLSFRRRLMGVAPLDRSKTVQQSRSKNRKQERKCARIHAKYVRRRPWESCRRQNQR